MLLGEVILSTLCDIFGETTYAIVRKILERVGDEDKTLYALAYTYGATMFEENGRVKIKRKIACLDLAQIINADHDDDRIYVDKPSADEFDRIMREVIRVSSSMLKSLLGDSAAAFLNYISSRLAKAFRGPNEVAIRATSELSRNPYAPKVSVEVEGRKIIVYSTYPITVSEEFLQGTLIPHMLAMAAALMMGYKGVRLVDSYIADKNTIVMTFEAYQ